MTLVKSSSLSSYGRCGVLPRSLLVPLLTTLTFIACPAMAQKMNCGDYAESAINQTSEHIAFQCKEVGDPQWWNLRDDYHRKWCDSLPANSDLPRLGQEARQQVLDKCMNPAAPPAPPARDPAQGSIEPPPFSCPDTFGTVQPRADQIKAYIEKPGPGYRNAAYVCDYYLAEGIIRVKGRWHVQTTPWLVVGSTELGCARKRQLPPTENNDNGFLLRSYDRDAIAEITGNTPTAVKIAQQQGQGPAQHLFILAEINARSCF